MQKPKISIIIVSYNTKDKIGDCLNSVSSDLEDLAGEVIVIDNASKDKSSQYIKVKFPQVKLIENKINLGFAKASNQAANLATGEFIFFLNPDTKVLPGCLKLLIGVVQERKNAAVFAPKILNPDGSLQNSVRNLPDVLRAVEEYFLGKEGAFNGFSPEGKNPIEVEAVVGAAMLVPRKIFEKLGRFDERYFLYYEDLDFCKKAKEAGYKVIFVPQAKIIHDVGASGRGEKEKTHGYLRESSRIYHGNLVSFLINVILFWGQKWQKLLGKT